MTTLLSAISPDIAILADATSGTVTRIPADIVIALAAPEGAAAALPSPGGTIRHDGGGNIIVHTADRTRIEYVVDVDHLHAVANFFRLHRFPAVGPEFASMARIAYRDYRKILNLPQTSIPCSH